MLADKLNECPQICFTLLFQAFYENNFVEKGQLEAYKQELEAKVCRHDSRQLAWRCFLDQRGNLEESKAYENKLAVGCAMLLFNEHHSFFFDSLDLN